ncbi:MAG: glycosyltransferase family 39 protein [bacterium]|nr:glycosyltransferase family 39 protein [bacterium]
MRIATYRKINTATLLGILMLGVIIFSYFVLSKQSLRLDEAQSLWQTSHSLSRILHLVAGDVHVPVYHFLLHFWQLFWGSGVGTARLLSLIFFVATIPAVYALGRLAYSSAVARFAAILIAISPFLNWYANEIRMYSLLTLLTVLNQYFFLRLFKDQNSTAKLWTGYVLTCIIGSFTHYFFAFGLLAQVIFALLHRHHFIQKKLHKKFIATWFLLFFLMLGWGWYVLQVGELNYSTPLLTAPTTINLFETFSQFIFGFQNDHLNTLIVSLWPLTALLAFLSLSRNNRITPETSFLVLTILIPIMGSFLFSITVRPLYLTRYLILSVPSLYLFLSWIFSTYHPSLSRAIKGVVVAAMLLTFGHQMFSSQTPVKENFREVSQYLEKNATSQDVIVISAPFTIYPIEYYYHGPAPLSTIPSWNRFAQGAIPAFSEDKLVQEVTNLQSNHLRAWVVLSYNQGYEQDIKLYFDTHFEQIEERNFSDGLNLYTYKLRYDFDEQQASKVSSSH